MCYILQHLKTMDKMWGRPGAGAPLRKEQKDFARKQKRKISCHWSFEISLSQIKEAECWNCNPETVNSVPVVDPGEGPTLPPLFLNQTKAQKAEKNFFWDCPPHYLKVWICHWIPN